MDEPEIRETDPPPEERPDSPVSKRVKWSTDHPAPSRETDPPPEERLTPEEAQHRSFLKEKCQHLVEGVPHQGDARLLQDIYSDLYITVGGSGEVNEEHEVRQIDRASYREVGYERPIKCSDIFKPLYIGRSSMFYRKSSETSDEEGQEFESEEEYEYIEREGSGDIEGEESSDDSRSLYPQRGLCQHKPIRVVLTKGVAGIGKTVSVQKFILDWTEGETNQDIHFIFPLPFRELNLMKNTKLSLVELIQHFFIQIKDLKMLCSSESKPLFIFDGLDECRLPLDFCSNPPCCEVKEPASVDVLLTNLINGNLLPSALVWITTRPAAAGQIPPECVDQVTEIRGFNDPQKEDYFKKRISDENQAMRVIRHLKSSRSLYIMCHIPVFSWILATVTERTSERGEMPRTLAQMYTHFLDIQTCIKKEKYSERKETDEEMVFKLGKLAFQQLEKGNLIFYEEDLRESGIDVTEASLYSGVCTQIFRVEAGLCHGRVFSFVHLTIQEFLAALYVFLCFCKSARHKPHQHQPCHLSALFRAATLEDLHKTAVDLALRSRNGHLDLFLRFLLGLSLESNQKLLRHLLPQTKSQLQGLGQIVQFVKDRIRQESKSGRNINLFYCLNELNQHAVVEHIDRSSGQLSVEMLLPGQWETGTFRFELSEEQLDGFDLQKYIKTPEEDLTDLLSPDDVLEKLVPVVMSMATSARLEYCFLTDKSCAAIAAAARSTSCSLKTLQLGGNELHDTGVQHLSDLLKDPQCKLETLGLMKCSLTDKSCAAIAAAARSTSCSLKTLLLSGNELHDTGVQHLSDLLKDPQCKLETLELSNCFLTEKSCKSIAAATRSTSCSLKTLILSLNELHDTGVQHLSDLLKDPQCKLEILVLSGRYGTLRREIPAAAAAAAAAASSSSSHSSDAAELHLTHNTQQHPGAQLLSTHTPTEDGPSDDTQRGCECCAEVPDTSHWVLVEPEVSTEKSISTYSLSSAAGSYECSKSSLRWLCVGPVTLQYHFMDWYIFTEELARMQCSPAGPLMDIKLMSGELEEIHLPHFLCLGGVKSAHDAVRLLHAQESGVCLEKCTVTQRHASLPQPSLSLFGPVYSYLQDLLSPKVHCQLLLFYQSTTILKLRTYLVPNDQGNIDAIHKQEENWKGERIKINSTVGSPLRLGDTFRVMTSCPSKINPGEIKLVPDKVGSMGNFCVVSFSIKHPEESFDVQVKRAQHEDPIWKISVEKEDYSPPSTSSGIHSTRDTLDGVGRKAIQTPDCSSRVLQEDNIDEFLKKNRARLIQKVTNVMQLADEMLSEDLINEEQYSVIKAETTGPDKMRCIYDALRSCGPPQRKKFFSILQELHSLLLQELGWH
ncbi:protein NLRC3-like [Engraulis encrasicolus]|uniref:protein NLRC3-like n=1 Tax=Engraulis encrasicolus TaxID=184585 RepID=UPI002FD5B20A